MKNYCIDCGKEVYNYKNVKRCKSCARKGELNPRFGKHTNFWTEENKKQMSNKVKGQNNPMYGTKRKDMSLRNKLITYPGNKNPNWKGGISFEPYASEWTNKLKEQIRKRDNYKCQLCYKTQKEEFKDINRKLSIHHIDYNKKNCKDNNLITLCNKCNSKVNFNRKWWKFIFKLIINYIYERR